MHTQGPTATVFPHSYSYADPPRETRIPRAIRKVVIVGGGSTPWLRGWYGYHFDAVLLGQFLHGKAEERGVCSGFAGLLIQKTLGTPWVSFSENLFNDAAVALPTPRGADIPSQTVSIAMKRLLERSALNFRPQPS